MRSRPTRPMSVLQAGNVHISLERETGRWLARFGYREIDGFGTHKLNIRAGGVEVGVVGHNVALLAGYTEQDALRRASLVGRNHVLVAKDILDGIPKAVKALAAGIAFVAFHDGGPLVS